MRYSLSVYWEKGIHLLKCVYLCYFFYKIFVFIKLIQMKEIEMELSARKLAGS